MQIGFYFDQTRCTGCSACRVACKDWNDIPAGPDVGPFVGGKASAGFTLSGEQRLELSGGSYLVTDGNITITENAEQSR